MRPSTQVLEVWGDLACFTRPELKVERFSYPVITPSAARGIFDAVFWKRPKFRWQVTQVEVLNFPSYIALRRNEVKQGVKERWPSVDAIEQWRQGTADPQPLWADGEDDTGRTQRQTMALRGVRYRLHAKVRPWPEFAADLPALEAQFRRRAASGKCVYQPYLGCREFPAYFRLVEEPDPTPPPARVDMDLGLMLYDVFDLSRPGGADDRPAISLFRASVKSGVMAIPEYEEECVLKAVKEECGCSISY